MRKKIGNKPINNSIKKYLGVNLAKKVKDLYKENFKTLKKAMETIKYIEKPSCS